MDEIIIEQMTVNQRQTLERLKAYMERMEKFIRVRDVDKEALSDLIVRAKGPRRSMRQFAQDLGVNPSTLSRIINQQFNGASKDELIVKIAACADPDSGVTLEMLMEAHGVEEKKQDDGFESYRKAETRMRQVILDELITRGYTVENAVAEQRAHDGSFCDLVLKTNAVEQGGHRWAFEFKLSRGGSNPGAGVYSRWIDHIMAILYRGTAEADKFSLVVEYRMIYEQLVERLEKFCIPDELSVILIAGNKIVEEYIVPMRSRDAKYIFKEGTE